MYTARRCGVVARRGNNIVTIHNPQTTYLGDAKPVTGRSVSVVRGSRRFRTRVQMNRLAAPGRIQYIKILLYTLSIVQTRYRKTYICIHYIIRVCQCAAAGVRGWYICNILWQRWSLDCGGEMERERVRRQK